MKYEIGHSGKPVSKLPRRFCSRKDKAGEERVDNISKAAKPQRPCAWRMRRIIRLRCGAYRGACPTTAHCWSIFEVALAVLDCNSTIEQPVGSLSCFHFELLTAKVPGSLRSVCRIVSPLEAERETAFLHRDPDKGISRSLHRPLLSDASDVKLYEPSRAA